MKHRGTAPERPSRAGVFLGGVATGLVVAALAGWLSLASVQRHGVTVEVDTAQVAEQVRMEVRTAARRELPGHLQSLQQTLVQRTTQEAAGRLAATKLDLGGFSVAPPPSLVTAVQNNLQEALKSGADRAMRNVNMDGLADQIGNRAFVLVQQRLNETLAGRTFTIRPVSWLAVPVRVVPR